MVDKAGPVDILINNAGIFKAVEFSETSAKDFEVELFDKKLMILKTNILNLNANIKGHDSC